MGELWTEKYAPLLYGDFIGNSTAVEFVKQWAEKWVEGVKQKPLLFYGATGVGKTALVNVLVNEYGFELLELNASDDRNAKKISRIAGLASVSKTFSGKKRLILFDEIDGLYRVDRGGAGAVVKILKENPCPIILTANDVWSQKLSLIRVYCEKVQFKKVHYATVAKLLQRIAEKEGIVLDYELAKKIAMNAGDVRSAVNDLQLITAVPGFNEKDLELVGSRDREVGIYDAVQVVLKTMDFDKSRKAIINVNEQPDFVLKWIEENVPNEYKDDDDLFNAFERISRADIFLGRVYKRMDYGLWRYVSVLMSAGVSLAKKGGYHSWVKYVYPSLIKKLSATKSSRSFFKSFGLKVGKQVHLSSRRAVSGYLFMFKELMKNKDKAVGLTAQFNFDEKELKFLGVKSPKKVIKEAEELKEKLIASKSIEKSNNSLSSFI